MQLGRLIGTGATAEVFEYGEGVLKLYATGVSRAAVDAEAAVLAVLERAGVAAPRSWGVVEREGRWGLAMSRAEGRSFGAVMKAERARIPEFIAAMVGLQRAIHGVEAPELPSFKARLSAHIERAERLAPADRGRLLEGLAAMPKGDRLCHGDFHPFNVLGEPGNAMVIDWVDASVGTPMADLARSFVLLAPHEPDLAETYVDAYLADARAERAAMEAWLPLVAAGRLGETIGEQEAALLLRLVAG